MLGKQIAGHKFWQEKIRHAKDNLMCEAKMEDGKDGKQLNCCGIADLVYAACWFYNYEPVIAWEKKRVLGELDVYPEGHTWGSGKVPPDEEAKADAIGKIFWEEERLRGGNIKHYYDQRPSAKVSHSKAGLCESCAWIVISEANHPLS